MLELERRDSESKKKQTYNFDTVHKELFSCIAILQIAFCIHMIYDLLHSQSKLIHVDHFKTFFLQELVAYLFHVPVAMFLQYIYIL